MIDDDDMGGVIVVLSRCFDVQSTIEDISVDDITRDVTEFVLRMHDSDNSHVDLSMQDFKPRNRVKEVVKYLLW